MVKKHKKNRTCECCGLSLSTPQKLRQHYAKIGESSHSEVNSSPEAKREYLEALRILEPIPQFHQMDIISSGCELLDDHYQ
ncbi:11694_t:CDS:2, partial [Diversispora eburnea]